MKSGFVAIVGKTNAGKSTLLNRILKQKVSIATPKPQTTRDSIQGIYNDLEAQIVFIDTPGILKSHQKLDDYMNRQISSSMDGVDALIYLVDAKDPFKSEKDQEAYQRILNVECPLFIVFNKIDLTNIFLISNLKKQYQEIFPNAKLIEISAKKDVNIDLLLNEVKAVLPEGVQYYPENVTSNHPLTFLIAEIIREKVLINLQEEVPHCVAVKIESAKKINQTLHIDATIICEKDSQKGIIIGAGGRMIKRIGSSARKELEKLLNRKINLNTFVRVENNWRDSNNYLKEFGYADKD